jgi:hypothetical protein
MKAYPLKVSELPSVNLEELDVCTFLLSLLSPSTPYTVTWKEKRATTEFFNKRVSASYSLSLIVSLSLSLSLTHTHIHTQTFLSGNFFPLDPCPFQNSRSLHLLKLSPGVSFNPYI